MEVGDFTRKAERAPRTVSVTSVKMHPQFDDSKSINDVAVLTLSESVDQSLVLRLCKSNHEDKPLAVCGMGYIDLKTKTFPEYLQEVQLQELNPRQCPAKG